MVWGVQRKKRTLPHLFKYKERAEEPAPSHLTFTRTARCWHSQRLLHDKAKERRKQLGRQWRLSLDGCAGRGRQRTAAWNSLLTAKHSVRISNPPSSSSCTPTSTLSDRGTSWDTVHEGPLPSRLFMVFLLFHLPAWRHSDSYTRWCHVPLQEVTGDGHLGTHRQADSPQEKQPHFPDCPRTKAKIFRKHSTFSENKHNCFAAYFSSVQWKLVLHLVLRLQHKVFKGQQGEK